MTFWLLMISETCWGFLQLRNAVRKNASSLFFSCSSFCRYFLQMKDITLSLTSLYTNHLYSTNHYAWNNRVCLAKAAFGNTNGLLCWFGFSLTISASVLLHDFLITSTEVVDLTRLVFFATFDLVLTGLKNLLILCFFIFFTLYPALAFSLL